MSTSSPVQPIADAGRGYCTFCGSKLDADQEWCLECGVARTVIEPAPDWRIPLAVIGVVVLGCLVAFAIALINLGGGSGSSAPTRAAASAATHHAGSLPVIESWPAGQDGWTVILDRTQDQTDAVRTARQLQAVGLSVGVLNSSEHPHLRPGYYIVFSGRYPTQLDAQAAAKKWIAAGQPGAFAHEIAPPGGI